MAGNIPLGLAYGLSVMRQYNFQSFGTVLSGPFDPCVCHHQRRDHTVTVTYWEEVPEAKSLQRCRYCKCRRFFNREALPKDRSLRRVSQGKGPVQEYESL